LVFAAFFHIYRYAMSQEKNTPPPAPVRVQEDIPELSEAENVVEVSADSKVSTDDSTKEN